MLQYVADKMKDGNSDRANVGLMSTTAEAH